MGTSPERSVLVGVDGSPQALAAVEYAAAEAYTRACHLRVLHAAAWPPLSDVLAPVAFGAPDADVAGAADRLLAEARAHATAAYPEIEVGTEYVIGAPAPVLVHAARHARLLVVGSHGTGGFADLLTGSVGAQVAAHTPGPVLVVRGAGGGPDPGAVPGRPDAPVVVGVDGSDQSTAAIGFAFAEAAVRGVALHAVHAWVQPTTAGAAQLLPTGYDLDEVQAEEVRLLAESLAGWVSDHPAVVVRQSVVRASPRRALLDASAEAQLVVVGRRGAGGFPGLLMGSVSQTLVHHARCPVAVVPS